jgi:hypothetical protein
MTNRCACLDAFTRRARIRPKFPEIWTPEGPHFLAWRHVHCSSIGLGKIGCVGAALSPRCAPPTLFIASPSLSTFVGCWDQEPRGRHAAPWLSFGRLQHVRSGWAAEGRRSPRSG